MRQSALKQSIKNTIVRSRREKRETPREEQETVEQFLARGGEITQCPPLNLRPLGGGKPNGCGRFSD